MENEITIQKAVEILKQNDVPEFFYSVGGLGNGECIGISTENGLYYTYFSEHGTKSSIKQFDTESAASEDFLKRIVKLAHDYGKDIKLDPFS
jgi:hypothetical protein